MNAIDVCVRGAGVVGQTMALLLSGLQLRVGLTASAKAIPANRPDIRSYALNAASRQLLESQRAWPEAATTPVKKMLVHGDSGGRVHFDASEQGVDALAWIVEAAALEAGLAQKVKFQPQIEILAEPRAAPLTIICEGHASSSRETLGVEFESLPYQQLALATRLRCERQHEGCAWQWFSGGEVLAFLPMDGPEGNSVAVVWSVNMGRQREIDAMDDLSLAHALELASHHSLGRLELCSARAFWPLQLGRTQRWVGLASEDAEIGAWALAGDAAHQLHPLAGQGLNMGLADAQEMARVLGSRDYWRGVSDMKLLRRYERARKLALAPLGLTVDGLQRMFALGNEAWGEFRNAGMNGFDRLGPVKSWVVARAMGQA